MDKEPPGGEMPPELMEGEGVGAMHKEMGGMEFPVPLKSLAQPNEADESTAPEVGDTGTVQLEYTVTRIEGETAFIEPKAIGGVPVTKPESKETPADEEAELRQMAGKMSEYQD